jgi:hypothetical protein
MYCRKCGSQNDDNAYRCVSCGEFLQHAVPPLPPQPSQSIPNYLAQSILVTLFCCLPLGIPAIVFSAQVNGKVQAGDFQGAMECSRKAMMWGWWSFGVGLGVVILYIIGALLSVAAQSAGH